MEEKKRGRPRLIKPADESQRYRSTPEELEELKEERLAKMKKLLKRGGTSKVKSETGIFFLAPDDNIGIKAKASQVDMQAAAVNAVPVAEIAPGDCEALRTAFEGNSTKVLAEQKSVKETSDVNSVCNSLGNECVDSILANSLTPPQIEALGKVCRTDDIIDEMLAALEESGANQRWLTAAKVSFQCAIMEITRAILKPKGV